MLCCTGGWLAKGRSRDKEVKAVLGELMEQADGKPLPSEQHKRAAQALESFVSGQAVA
jgi:hypothetical protein